MASRRWIFRLESDQKQGKPLISLRKSGPDGKDYTSFDQF